MQFRHFLAEIAQRGQGLRSGLDLVQKQQVRPGGKGSSGEQGQCVENPRRVLRRKRLTLFRVAFKVDLQQRHPRHAGEFTHQSGFADLSGPPHHQRLAPRLCSPLPQVVEFMAVQKILHGAP